VDVPLEPADKYETYMNTRPPSFEQSAIHMVIDTMLDEAQRIAAKDGFHVHVAHLADAGSLPMIKVGWCSARPCVLAVGWGAQEQPGGAARPAHGPPCCQVARCRVALPPSTSLPAASHLTASAPWHPPRPPAPRWPRRSCG
jgi:hypothetical protein